MTGGWAQAQRLRSIAVLVSLLAGGCTLHHSKIPLSDSHAAPPTPDAVFITEDDAGLALLGVFVVTEPDHYAVLIERARRRHNCAEMHHIQLDFYTDYWVFVGFPIARITAVCEPPASAPAPAPAPAPVKTPG